jgi:hypothetical protein
MRRHSAHVDANVLAELSAGLVSDRRATRIHAHLAGCQHCARLSAGLAEIGTLLASVPSPAMPDSVTRRLNATLAREAAERSARVAAPEGPTSQVASDRVLNFRGGASKGRRRGFTSPAAARAFAAAAAACVVAAGGYTVVRLSSNGPAPSSGHNQAGAPLHSARSSGAAPLPFIQTPPIGSTGTNILSFKVIDSGIDYRAPTLGSQITAELGQVATRGPARSSGADALHAPSSQQYGCVMDVTGDTEPALVDSARYNGNPATIIALAHVGNQVSQAWVVGPACSADNPAILEHVTLPTSGG